MKTLECAKKKMGSVKQKIERGLGVMGGFMLSAYYSGMEYCSGLFDNKVTVNATGVTPDKIAGNVLTIIAGVCIMVGLFMCAGGIIKYLQAKAEDNSSGESKATMSIGIGIAFIAMPFILNTLFN